VCVCELLAESMYVCMYVCMYDIKIKIELLKTVIGRDKESKWVKSWCLCVAVKNVCVCFVSFRESKWVKCVYV
jgi:hypothetical protein